MMRGVQRRPLLHRWLGRVTGAWVMVGLVPSGAVLAFNAKGGVPVSAGFLLSGAIIAYGMVYGVLAARRRDMVAHSRAMRHVVAQMSVAVFSRAMIVGFDVLEFDPDVAYVISLWVPVLFTAAVAEAVSRRSRLSLGNFLTLVTQTMKGPYHALKPHTVLVRARSYGHSVARHGR
jgi:hypothetical protein